MTNYFQQRTQRNLTPVIQPNPSRMQRNPARAIQPNPSHMQSDQSNLSDFQEHQFNSSHAPHPNLPPPQHQQKQLVTEDHPGLQKFPKDLERPIKSYVVLLISGNRLRYYSLFGFVYIQMVIYILAMSS